MKLFVAFLFYAKKRNSLSVSAETLASLTAANL
jgi:hypothetical protein